MLLYKQLSLVLTVVYYGIKNGVYEKYQQNNFAESDLYLLFLNSLTRYFIVR